MMRPGLILARESRAFDEWLTAPPPALAELPEPTPPGDEPGRRNAGIGAWTWLLLAMAAGAGLYGLRQLAFGGA